MKKNIILEKQTDYIYNKFKNKYNAAKFLTDIKQAISSSIQKLVDIAFKPSFKYNKSIRFDKTEQTNDLENIILDLNVLNDSINYLNNEITSEFNTIQDFKTKSKNELNKLKSYIRQIDFLKGKNNTEIFVNTFNNYDQIDLTATEDNEINIMTSEGIVTLPIYEEKILSEEMNIGAQILTNGSLGNYNIIEKNEQYNNNIELEYSNEYYFCSDINPRDNTSNIIDGNSDTWLEIQSFDKPLNVEIKLNLDRQTKVNWIDISPYIPKTSKNSFIVESIKYRDEDGTLKNIYSEDYINKEIGLSFSSNNLNKYFEQGVFTFDTINTDQIIIYLNQQNTYDVKIGEYVYSKKINNQFCNISADMAPEEVQDGTEGIYYIRSFVEKEIDGYILTQEQIDIYKKEIHLKEESKRYFIGIRDINLKYNIYSNYSEIITKEYNTINPIERIKLNTIEQIPDRLINIDCLKYYISIGDNTWHEIRPNNIINTTNNIVPIVYELNSILDPSVQELNVNTGYINSTSNSIRLKIVFTLTDQTSEYTPILEEYALIVEEASQI